MSILSLIELLTIIVINYIEMYYCNYFNLECIIVIIFIEAYFCMLLLLILLLTLQ